MFRFLKFLFAFVFAISCLEAHAKTDTLKYFMDYAERKLPKHVWGEYYYRVQFKDGPRWHVKDYYLKEKRLYHFAMYSDRKLTVLEGVSSYFHRNGALKSKQRYVHGKKEGLYREYDENGMLLDSTYYLHDLPVNVGYAWYDDGTLKFKGLYDKEGKGSGEEWRYHKDGSLLFYGKRSEGYLKDSIWTYYHKNGVVAYEEHCRAGLAVDSLCFDTSGNRIASGFASERMPEPTVDVNRYLSEQIRFPQDAMETVPTGYQCAVHVKLRVMEDGTVDIVERSDACHPSLNKEASRVVAAMPPWKPGIYYNRPVQVYYTLPIVFRLEGRR